MAFGWEGPLQVNGEVQPISGFKHYESMYGEAEMPAQSMVIRHGDHALRLKFTLEADDT